MGKNYCPEWEWQKEKRAENLHERSQKALERAVSEIVNPKVNNQSAKGVDVFGRSKAQIEMSRLHRAGSKGIRVK